MLQGDLTSIGIPKLIKSYLFGLLGCESGGLAVGTEEFSLGSGNFGSVLDAVVNVLVDGHQRREVRGDAVGSGSSVVGAPEFHLGRPDFGSILSRLVVQRLLNSGQTASSSVSSQMSIAGGHNIGRFLDGRLHVSKRVVVEGVVVPAGRDLSGHGDGEQDDRHLKVTP